MRFFYALIAAAAATVLTTNAKSMPERQIDSLLQSHKIVYIDGRPQLETERHTMEDSLRQRIASFYYDQFRHFLDPAAPYFLFMSKDANLAMGVGGCVRMRAYYDWGGAMPIPGFSPYLIAMHPQPEHRKHLGTTPSGTCLFFRVLGRNKALGEYQLYIEADFTGYESRDFKLKKAYAIINDLTVGYASSTFSDPSALPPTIDAQGPSNKITPTAVLVRYMRTFRKNWTAAVSVETPQPVYGSHTEYTAKVDEWIPDFAAFAQYQWAPGQHVRLSAITRSLPYRNLVEGKNRSKSGWATMLSATGHITDRITGYATLNYGHGYASLGGDLMIGAYDLIAPENQLGTLYAPRSAGYCLGVQYNFRPDLFSTVSMSQTRYLPKYQAAPSEYKYGWVAMANVFWNMTPRMQVGAELNLGKRQNFSGEHRYARRAELMCMFTF